ncbi:MAG: hypothetical protein ABWZ78_12745 [Burkholderiaceae bacterium]
MQTLAIIQLIVSTDSAAWRAMLGLVIARLRAALRLRRPGADRPPRDERMRRDIGLAPRDGHGPFR